MRMMRGFDAANDEKEKRVEDVENPQLLVIDGDNPIVQPFADRPCARRFHSLIAIVSEAMTILSPSSQRLEVRGERVQIFFVQLHRRHQRAWLDRVGILESTVCRFSGVFGAAPEAIVSRLIR